MFCFFLFLLFDVCFAFDFFLFFVFPPIIIKKQTHTESNSCPGRMCANANNSIKAARLNYDTKSNAIPRKRNKQIWRGKKKRSCYMIRINLRIEKKKIWRGWFVFFFSFLLRLSPHFKNLEDIDGGSAWKGAVVLHGGVCHSAASWRGSESHFITTARYYNNIFFFKGRRGGEGKQHYIRRPSATAAASSLSLWAAGGFVSPFFFLSLSPGSNV